MCQIQMKFEVYNHICKLSVWSTKAKMDSSINDGWKFERIAVTESQLPY